MKLSYTQTEFDELISGVSARSGWDFSSMNVFSAPVPWEYIEEVKNLLKITDSVLDIGTGGGERFVQLASVFGQGLGTDIDPKMIETAKENAVGINNISFQVDNSALKDVIGQFDVITNRHAPFDIDPIKHHLKKGGIFITQQVGENNMTNIKKIIGSTNNKPSISKAAIEEGGLQCIEFKEYDVEYIVKDIESLVFWLNALDMLHSDIAGGDAIADVETLNAILKGNVSEQGFVTNEHRYLVVAELVH